MLLATLGICSEYISELFRDIPYGKVIDGTGYVYEVNYKDAVWYFIYSLFVFILVITVLIDRIRNENKSGAVILSGLAFWFAIELYEKVCFLAKINNNRLFINDGSVWQICTMLFVMFLAWRGLSKYKY